MITRCGRIENRKMATAAVVVIMIKVVVILHAYMLYIKKRRRG